MIKPPTPVDEFRRLETLRSLNLLGTPPEERFDRVTRLAKKIFGAPIALISLVDEERQWFKSCQGLEMTETPREVSFCSHTILDEHIMVVSDALEDERFCDNPLVQGDPNIRFYAGYPLSAPDGSKVGTLCVIDREPRELDDEDMTLLRELGRIVEEELIPENTVLNDPATGLSNRSGFSLVVEHLLAYCERTDTPAWVLVVHFTNLGAIDDELGYAEGDRAASELAHLLLASFRDSDIVGRIAADVFAILLPASDFDGGEAAGERLQHVLGERNRKSGDAYELHVSLHGVAYHPDRHPDIEALMLDVEGALDNACDSGMDDLQFSDAG